MSVERDQGTVPAPPASALKAGDRALALVSDGLLKVEEAARFLGVSRATVYVLMDSGMLVFVKLGRSRRIPKRAVVEFAAGLVQGGEMRGA